MTVVVEKPKPAARARRKPAASAEAGGTATPAGETGETAAPAESDRAQAPSSRTPKDRGRLRREWRRSGRRRTGRRVAAGPATEFGGVRECPRLCPNSATRGQARALAEVRSMVLGRTPHAVLFVGPSSVGKTTLALDLAAGLLCRAPDAAERPCRECRGCRLVASGNHPDLHRLAPEGPGGQVRIGSATAPEPGTVRHLIGELSLSTRRGRSASGDRGAGPPPQRRRPERAAQDARGAARRSHDHPVRRRRAVPAADRSFALRPEFGSAAVAVREIERWLGELGALPTLPGLPGWQDSRAAGPDSPSPMPVHPTRNACAARLPAACWTCSPRAGTSAWSR